MERELKRAMTRAGLKLGGGLALIAALVGIRVVTAEPAGVAEGVAALERLEAELAAETARDQADGATRPATRSTSAHGEAEGRLRDALASRRRSERPADADRLVSCELGGTVQFMRAADCLSRGGDSTDFDPED
jgi:hypothetical protein